MDALDIQINTSALQPAEKIDLIRAFADLDEESRDELAKICGEQPQLIPIMHGNLSAKQAAVQNNDAEAFDRAVDEEVDILESQE